MRTSGQAEICLSAEGLELGNRSAAKSQTSLVSESPRPIMISMENFFCWNSRHRPPPHHCLPKLRAQRLLIHRLKQQITSSKLQQMKIV